MIIFDHKNVMPHHILSRILQILCQAENFMPFYDVMDEWDPCNCVPSNISLLTIATSHKRVEHFDVDNRDITETGRTFRC